MWFFSENLEPILVFIVAMGAMIGYFLTRSRELAWKRTEFMCAQAQYLDNDSDLLEVVRILEDRHETVTIHEVFNEESNLTPEVRRAYQQKFDKLFNFLWRLCYAYSEVRTLSAKEVEGFGWYFWRISKSPVLVEYCKENGYQDINQVTEKLRLDKDDHLLT